MTFLSDSVSSEPAFRGRLFLENRFLRRQQTVEAEPM
jgi:hypothetical protein